MNILSFEEIKKQIQKNSFWTTKILSLHCDRDLSDDELEELTSFALQ
jgi:hypothetical protein